MTIVSMMIAPLGTRQRKPFTLYIAGVERILRKSGRKHELTPATGGFDGCEDPLREGESRKESEPEGVS